MGRDLHYVPGSFYRVDDRTGFAQRAGRTRKEWTGLIVDEEVFERRQPQDLVKGVRDQQSVLDARPVSPATYVGPVFTSLTARCPPKTTVLPLDSVAGFGAGVSVSVMLDSGVNYMGHQVGASGASSITITPGLPSSAASGNVVTLNPPGAS